MYITNRPRILHAAAVYVFHCSEHAASCFVTCWLLGSPSWLGFLAFTSSLTVPPMLWLFLYHHLLPHVLHSALAGASIWSPAVIHAVLSSLHSRLHFYHVLCFRCICRLVCLELLVVPIMLQAAEVKSAVASDAVGSGNLTFKAYFCVMHGLHSV